MGVAPRIVCEQAVRGWVGILWQGALAEQAGGALPAGVGQRCVDLGQRRKDVRGVGGGVWGR